MASSIVDTEGSRTIAQAVVQAIMHQADLAADLTVAFLRDSGLASVDAGGQSEPVGLSAKALLELGTVLQLQYLTRNGLAPHLRSKLPSSREATLALADRLSQGPESFAASESPPLLHDLMEVFARDLAWDAPEILQAEVVVGNVDEDTLIEALAKLVWAHRHDPPVVGDKSEKVGER